MIGIGAGEITSEYGNDGFVYRLDLFLLEYVAREEGGYEKHDHDKEGP